MPLTLFLDSEASTRKEAHPLLEEYLALGLQAPVFSRSVDGPCISLYVTGRKITLLSDAGAKFSALSTACSLTFRSSITLAGTDGKHHQPGLRPL